MCVSVHTAPQWCGSCHEHHPTDWLGRCPFGTLYIPRSCRVHVVCMPTRTPPLHTTAPTSAYPGHDPRPWLLRASSAPAACGWHLLRKVTGLPEGRWGFLRSPSPLFEPLGRRYPPGFVSVPTGQSDGCQRRILCRFGSSVSASYAGFHHRTLFFC